MLDFVEGICLEKRPSSIVIRVAGFGLEVYVPSSTLKVVALNEPTTLYTYFHYTEKNIALYGFLRQEDRHLFIKLSRVSGMGPRKALEVMRADITTIRRWIEKGDVQALANSPGIGKKLAQRMVLELRGKLDEIKPMTKEMSLVQDALKKLGYEQQEIQYALQSLYDEEKASVEEMIKKALQTLARR